MTSTISKVAYKAVWDSSNLAKGLMGSRAMFLEQKKILASMQTPMDRYTQAQQNLKTMLEKYQPLQQHKLMLEQKLEAQYLREEQALRKLTSTERERLRILQASTGDQPETEGSAGFTLLGRDPRLAAAALAAGAGLGAKKMISEGVDAYRDLERVEAAFNVFSGSLAESRDLIQQIRDLSAQTGVSFAGLSDGAKTLMLRDINAKETVSMMQKIAIVTGGNTDNMKSMALAMGQINQAGKLMGQELIQLVNAGWTPLEEIVKKTGIPMTQMRKEMEEGRISFQMVSDALDAAVSEGGRYFGFLESLEGTTARAADKTASAWEQASARIGAAFKPVSLAWSELSSGFAGGSADLFEGLGSWLSTYFDRETAIKNQISAWESSGGNAMVGMIGRESTDLDAKLAPGMKRARDFDARMKAEQEAKQKALEADKKAAQAREAALKPTEAGASVIKQLNQEFEREQLLSMKLAEGDSQRVKAMQERLNLAEKIANQEKRSAELKKDGASETEIRQILAFEEKLSSVQSERERAKIESDRKRKLMEDSQRVADRYRSPDDRIVDELADLELARRRGALSQPEFDRASLGLVQDRSTTTGSLASNMRVGSQEAYQFMAGVQDRGKREEMAKHRETVRLQGLMLKAIEKLDSTMQQLEPVGVAG